MKQNRNFSLDLLRIVSMMMVVGLHFFNHSGLRDAVSQSSPNWYISNLLFSFCNVCVNCFVLLSGYFQCEASFKLKRVVSTWLQAAVYSVGIYLLYSILKGTFSLFELLKSGLVVTMQRYWFVSSYIIMYALSPFLNCAIAKMSKRMHFLCCCVLLGLFSVLANIFYTSDFAYLKSGYSPVWFCTLYVTAAYVRKHVPAKHKYRLPALVCYLLFASMIAIDRFAVTAITPMIFGSVKFYSLFYSYNSIMTAAASISLLLFFRSIEIKNVLAEKAIRYFAPLAFGVYLIHDHIITRQIIWNWLKPTVLHNSPFVVPYFILCVTGIFLVCSLIEWLRQKLFRLCRIDRLVNSLCDKLQSRVERWLGES